MESNCTSTVSVSPQNLLFHFILSLLRHQPEHQLFRDMMEVFWVWTLVFSPTWCNSVPTFGKMPTICVRVIIHFVDLWYLRRLLTFVNGGDYLITPYSFNTKALKRVVGGIVGLLMLNVSIFLYAYNISADLREAMLCQYSDG